MNKVLVLGLFLIFGACFGQESNYTYIGSSEVGDKIYGFIEKNDTEKEIVNIWVKNILASKTIKNKSGKYVKINGDELVKLDRVSCKDKKYFTLHMTKYNNKGDVVYSDNFKEYSFSEYEYILPNSVMEGVYNFACGYGEFDCKECVDVED